jgi:Family of unknown function (DUF5357)
MNLFFKDVFGIFKFLESVYERIRRILVPPKAYSWQTLIYLSVFSGILSSFAEGAIRDIISFFGWLFLIAGTAWYTTDDPLRLPGTFMPLGAIITGFLVSVFAFGREDTVVTRNTIVLWPTISAIITAIPEFFEGSGTDVQRQLPKIEIRQRLVVLVACCMVLSCWLQLYFLMDTWLQEYPSLLSDNFRRSNFVVRTEPPARIPPNGVLILDKLQPQVEAQIAGRPWSQVERWLLDANTQVGTLGQRVIDKHLAEYEEKNLWRVGTRKTNPNPKNKDEYQLDLLSIWTGPSSNPRGYYLRKSCKIAPIVSTRNPNEKVLIAEIECDRISKFIAGAPPPQE